MDEICKRQIIINLPRSVRSQIRIPPVIDSLSWIVLQSYILLCKKQNIAVKSFESAIYQLKSAKM